jgi:hypothetical protein
MNAQIGRARSGSLLGSVFDRAPSRSIARSRDFDKSGQAARPTDRECAFARGLCSLKTARSKEVGSPSPLQADAPAGVKTIDLVSSTLLPGLIDSHTHLLLDVVVPAEVESTRRDNGDFVPGLLLAIVATWPSERACCWARNWNAKTCRAVSPLCATSRTQVLIDGDGLAGRSSRFGWPVIEIELHLALPSGEGALIGFEETTNSVRSKLPLTWYV